MADNIVIRSGVRNVTVSSLGTGETIITFVSGGTELLIKTIDDGGIIDVSTSTNNTIIVSAIALRSVSALGGGTSIISSVSGSREILFRTFSNSSDVLIQTSANEITFRTRNAQVSAVTGQLSEPLLFTIATAKSSAQLSVETTNVILARSGAFAANSVILFDAITDTNARLPMPYDCRIIRVAGSITANATSDKTISLFVDGTEFTNILTFPVTAVRYNAYNMNVNITVNAGQGISAIVRGGGGNISNVSLCVWLKIFIPG